MAFDEKKLSKKNQEFFQELKKEIDGFRKGHFYYVITNLSLKDLNRVIGEIFMRNTEKGDRNGFHSPGNMFLHEEGNIYTCEFHTGDKFIAKALNEISSAFPNAHCYYQDCWDYPDVLGCLVSGQENKDCYEIKIDGVYWHDDYDEMLEDGNELEDEDYFYDLEGTLTDDHGFYFEIGAGCVSKDSIENIFKLANEEFHPDEVSYYYPFYEREEY